MLFLIMNDVTVELEWRVCMILLLMLVLILIAARVDVGVGMENMDDVEWCDC